MGVLDDLVNITPGSIEGKAPPPTRLVDWFHGRVSTTRDTDIHHPLGNGPGAASPGDHTHDGKRGAALWSAADIPADLPASPTSAQFRDATNAILAQLRKKAV